MPHLHIDGNPHLVSPGVKWGVTPQSFTHCTELFGPVLGVMEAHDLHEAIELANATGFGLTSGLESLDDREQQLWQESIRAGNPYINRPTTGAIVLRQPFGGMGKSAVGPGIKAGGPNYVATLMDFEDDFDPSSIQIDLGDTALDDFCETLRQTASSYDVEDSEVERVVQAAQSYEYWMAEEFSQQHDHFRLVGEDNFRRYLPLSEVHVRVHPEDSLFEIFARVLACRTAGYRTVVSTRPNMKSSAVELIEEITQSWAGGIEFVEETDEDLSNAIKTGQLIRLRYASANCVPIKLRQAAAAVGHYIADRPVSAHGRVELLWYLQEQSLTHIYHRYGNLGARAHEQRAEVS